MRKPTPDEAAYRWWRAALAGEKPPVHEVDVHAGWFKTRAWSRGPFLAGRIWIVAEIDFETGELTEPERFEAEIGGQKWRPEEAWLRLAKYPVMIEEFRWLMAMQPIMPPKPELLRRRSVFADVY